MAWQARPAAAASSTSLATAVLLPLAGCPDTMTSGIQARAAAQLRRAEPPCLRTRRRRRDRRPCKPGAAIASRAGRTRRWAARSVLWAIRSGWRHSLRPRSRRRVRSPTTVFARTAGASRQGRHQRFSIESTEQAMRPSRGAALVATAARSVAAGRVRGAQRGSLPQARAPGQPQFTLHRQTSNTTLTWTGNAHARRGRRARRACRQRT